MTYASVYRREIGLGILALVISLAGAGCERSPVPERSSASAATGAVAVSTAPAVPDYQKLVGKWLRPDGGYVFEIRACDAASGRLDATYLNPRPIHVGKAEARQEGGKLTVFVELQDVNYPGCTYRLTYFPQTDQLYGTYYQAAIEQSFEVYFDRMR
jgi:hypothetical protein